MAAHRTKVKEALTDMRISVGTASFYFKPFHQVLEIIAAAISKVPGMSPSTITPDRLQEIAENIRSGRYQDDDVVETIADRIRKDL